MRSVLGLLLILACPSLPGPVHGTTRGDPTFKRRVTTCTDSARTITCYDEAFTRFQTAIITPSKDDKAPHGWPVPEKSPRERS